MQIRNPVLRGFHPDPSILRVGEDYYLATSTFEWWPGVRIHHSRDLANWRPLPCALDRPSQFNLHGIPDSGGIWAPSLSYSDGLFYLVYTVVRTRVGPFKDVDNFLVTTIDLERGWSDPVYLNSTGFDPSLFHDADGRKWLLNIQWDYRPEQQRFAGIVAQEYDPRAGKLVGKEHRLLRKSALIEGPNLYKIGAWYYLLLAEGGTSWNHAVTVARAPQVLGPYELDPQEYLLSTRHSPDHPLQKAGHGSLVQTPAGDWYVAYLCSRPLQPHRRCMLGRETAIAPCTINAEGWLRCPSADAPPLALPLPSGQDWHPHAPAGDDGATGFTPPALGREWSSLRRPIRPEWLSFCARPGWLRMRGGESPASLFDQSFIARRIGEYYVTAETCVDFQPKAYLQSAGLTCWYDTRTFYYLQITHQEKQGRIVTILCSEDGAMRTAAEGAPLPEAGTVWLRATIRYDKLQFEYRQQDQDWRRIGPALDASVLSDDFGQGLHFTGAFIGLRVEDLQYKQAFADFQFFSLQEQESPSRP